MTIDTATEAPAHFTKFALLQLGHQIEEAKLERNAGDRAIRLESLRALLEDFRPPVPFDLGPSLMQPPQPSIAYEEKLQDLRDRYANVRLWHDLKKRLEEAHVNLFELHEKMTAHLFPAYSSTDEKFLALALCGEVGELANMIKKRWRDDIDLSEEIKDEIADARVYLELLAKCFGIEGEKLDQRVKAKLLKVAEKHKARLAT